jgi:hypothetical protein
MKTYFYNGDVSEFIANNSEEIFDNIVEAVDANQTFTKPVIVCQVQTEIGLVEFVINTPEIACDSLKRAEKWYAANDMFEKAAKALNLQRIYTKNNKVNV